jgi:hypothetical protein
VIKYAYAQLFIGDRDDERIAMFIDHEGRVHEWKADYDTLPLNRAAADGWRVVNVQTDPDIVYLLEKQVSADL